MVEILDKGLIMDLSSIDSSWKGHEYFVQWLIKELNPKVTVEIGTYKGFSAYWLAKDNKGTVYTIDIKDYGAEEALKEMDNIVFSYDGSDKMAESWDKKIDLLHIDGNHTHEAVSKDLNIWLKHLNTETGVTIMHDVLSMAWPAPFVAFMNTKGVDQDGIGLRKRVFLNDQGLGLMTFNDDIIQKIDEKYKTLIVSDHSIATIYNYINKHNRDNNK